MQQPLRMVRGTTFKINVSLYDKSGAVVTLGEGDVLRFGIKKKPGDTTYIIEKTTTTRVGDYYVIPLAVSDTSALELGKYYYDIGLQSGEDYYMVVECSTFEIAVNITAYEDDSEEEQQQDSNDNASEEEEEAEEQQENNDSEEPSEEEPEEQQEGNDSEEIPEEESDEQQEG